MNQPKPNSNAPQQYSAHLVGGPLPDPITLEKYEEIHPGFAERILIIAEKEQAHRHSTQLVAMENQQIQHQRDTNTFRIGQVFAIMSVLLIIALCVYCLYLRFPTQAATIATTVIIGLAAVFVLKDKTK